MEKIVNKKKQGSIVDVLKDAILSGMIAAGEELTQVELAESLGVSRMPVREALIVLEYQGLVRRLPNNHVKVAVIDEDYIASLFKLASQLEVNILKNLNIDNFVFSDEMDFHRRLYALENTAFLSKTLETIIEIYASFCVSAHPSSERVRLLEELKRKVIIEEWNSVEAALEGYYALLLKVFREDRR